MFIKKRGKIYLKINCPVLWPGLALTQTQPATGLAVHCTAETLPKYTAKKCTVFTSVGNYGFSESTELPKAACTSFLS